MQRRLAEVEELLTDKSNKLEQAQKELDNKMGQFSNL